MESLILGVTYLVLLTFLITGVFSLFFKQRGPWGSFWIFFFIVLLAVFAADVWVGPVGPYYNNIYWVPPLATGLLVALLLAATTPSPKTRSELELQQGEIGSNRKAAYALGTFFWFLILFLFIVVIVGLFFSVT